MNSRTQLVFGVTGQVVEFYPPESVLGAASAGATYSVFGPQADLDGTAEFTGSATLDSVSTTFDAASGFSNTSDRDRCYLTATTNIAIGRTYLATTTNNQKELVKVDAIKSADWVSKEGPLFYDYVSTDTFLGLRHSFTVDATWIAEEENIGTDWKILWVYTIGGVSYRAWTYLDVVRAVAKADITGAELYELFPDLRHEQHADLRGTDWEHIKEYATKQLRFDIQRFGTTLDQIRSDDWNIVLLNGMRFALAESGWHPPGRDQETFVTDSKAKYWESLSDIAKRVLVDKGTSGAATQKGVAQLTFRR
jgi:hypothetical protein